MAEDERPEFTCTTCLVSFPDYETMRAHYKTDWHIYNSRRKVAGLAPISKELWDKKWKDVANQTVATKGTSHIKCGKKEVEQPSDARKAVKKERQPWKLGDSLFDDRQFDSVEKSLDYMRKKYTFFLPDENYITDKNALLTRLAEMIEKEHRCIFCGRQFSSFYACRQHMVDLRHCRIGSENDEIMAELDRFYDFRASIAEYKFKSKAKQEKVKQLLCELENIKEEEEMKEGDSESSMEVVTEDDEAEDNSDWEEVDEEIDDEELIRMAELGEDAEVVECDDEEDFERVMRELGLKPAEITATGDLCLPNGKTVVHRDMAYIYRQRGVRGRVQRQERVEKNRLMLADGAAKNTSAGYNHRQLMKREKANHPWLKVATRAAKRDQKAVIAVLRRANKDEQHLWVKRQAQGNIKTRRINQSLCFG